MSSGGDNKIATYEDVKRISLDKNMDTILIDVREPAELVETGVLPSSINIPLGEVDAAFREISDEEFKRRYGCDKPEPDRSIVLSCKSGIRSEKALQIIEKLGYLNVRNYKGGWLDWEESNKKSV